jgi:hypothetical protein
MERERRNTVDWLVSENPSVLRVPFPIGVTTSESETVTADRRTLADQAWCVVLRKYRDAGTSHACRTRQ